MKMVMQQSLRRNQRLFQGGRTKLTWIIFMGLYPPRAGDNFFVRAALSGAGFCALYCYIGVICTNFLINFRPKVRSGPPEKLQNMVPLYSFLFFPKIGPQYIEILTFFFNILVSDFVVILGVMSLWINWDGTMKIWADWFPPLAGG